MSSAAHEASTSAGPDPLKDLGLAEMMRIMDVATALRQDRELVEEQLNFDQLKARLRDKLTAAAKVTGEQVSDAEVDAAIEQYYSNLHAFREPPHDFRITLARLWVRRQSILTWGAAGLAALALLVWLFFLPSGPFNSRGRVERKIAALSQSIHQHADRIKVVSKDPSVNPDVAKLVAEAVTYQAQQDTASLEKVDQQLAHLEESLREEYTVSVVAAPGKKSGIDRYFTDSEGKRVSGYYLIVEARRADGTVLRRRIHNSETGQVEEVSVWGERVPKDVYDRLARDRREDGILNETTFAIKRAGFANEEVQMKGNDGQVLTRMGQITKW
jgi:hypothetical protein